MASSSFTRWWMDLIQLSVQEICDRTGLLQAHVSRHPRLMKDAAVVDCRRQGVWHYYRVIDIELLSLCAHRKPLPKLEQ